MGWRAPHGVVILRSWSYSVFEEGTRPSGIGDSIISQFCELGPNWLHPIHRGLNIFFSRFYEKPGKTRNDDIATAVTLLEDDANGEQT